LRKSHPALYAGEIEFMSSPDDVLLYKRMYRNEQLIIALNFSSAKKAISIGNTCKVLLSSTNNQFESSHIVLEPFEAMIATMQ